MSWDTFELIGSHTDGAWIDDPDKLGEHVWMPPHAALSWRGTWQERQYGDYIIFAPPDVELSWLLVWEAVAVLANQAERTLEILAGGNGDA